MYKIYHFIDLLNSRVYVKNKTKKPQESSSSQLSVPSVGIRGLSVPQCVGTRGFSVPQCVGTRGFSVPQCVGTRGLSVPQCVGTRGFSVLSAGTRGGGGV